MQRDICLGIVGSVALAFVIAAVDEAVHKKPDLRHQPTKAEISIERSHKSSSELAPASHNPSQE
jgi:capsular polysaccharide biosynthesis protein